MQLDTERRSHLLAFFYQVVQEVAEVTELRLRGEVRRVRQLGQR